MLSDPIVLAVSGNNKSMARIESSGRRAVYQTSDGLYTLTTSQTPSKDGGHKAVFRVDRKVMATDPFDASKQAYKVLGCSILFDIPSFGFASTDLDATWTGIETLMDTTLIGRLFGGEF